MTVTPETPLQVAVLGARGKLGSAICTAIDADSSLDLAAPIGRGDDLASLVAAGVQVAVDVTTPESVMHNVQFLVEHGIHAIVGTTGFDQQKLDAIQSWLDVAPGVGVLIAPNFSIGAMLLMQFAAKAAPFYESVEIVELHHPAKIDAPSGTARHTAAVIADARRAAGSAAMPDATTMSLDGARGAVVDGIHVHALRIRGLVAHEEVILGNVGETLTLRHDAPDRAAFGVGAVAAIKAISSRPGLHVGLDSILDL